MQSLRSRLDQLHLNVTHLCDYRDTCLVVFTQTRHILMLKCNIRCHMTNRWCVAFRPTNPPVCYAVGNTRKRVCILILNCKNNTVCKQLCLLDIKLPFVSMRPFYLPSEFPQINIIRKWISSVHSLQSLSPEGPNIVLGDFNHCDLKKALGSVINMWIFPHASIKLWINLMVP